MQPFHHVAGPSGNNWTTTKNKMNIKTILWGILAAGLLAGCETEKSEQAKQAALEGQAKISKTNAQQTALQQVPNGTVKEAEIEKEHGKLIWSFDIAVPDSKDIKEVAVDALTGQVVSIETETAEQESKEKD
jgi:uncharacterized membrane protein YkoI